MKLNVAVVGEWIKKREGFLQLLTASIGVGGILYGLQVLMVERAAIPVCSAELLMAVGEDSFLGDQELVVEVAGAVVNSGVWQFKVGSRVADAIEKAGGFSQRADRLFSAQGLNLARALEDGEKLYIPFEGEKEAQNTQTKIINGVSQTNAISVNNASTKELQTLPGIGEVRAAQIIENRPYSLINELLDKKILTETVFNDLKGLIVL